MVITLVLLGKLKFVSVIMLIVGAVVGLWELLVRRWDRVFGSFVGSCYLFFREVRFGWFW